MTNKPPNPNVWPPNGVFPNFMIAPLNYKQHFAAEKAKQQLPLRLEDGITSKRPSTEATGGTDQS